ncbi:MULTISPECIES: hypothetical protein [unclassified Bacillus (in: firmicutes)]|uniref:hypothetical protein n=1 Tax=unclassified Bacillus (in: firmicutes) TaxID=185979 RepID=UPI0020D26BC6|nr:MULTISPECIES: hypothetical protein [unclassified Bacillus (in: firmicutes)]
MKFWTDFKILIWWAWGTIFQKIYGAMTGIMTGVLVVLYATIFNIKIANFFLTVPHAINDISTGAIALFIHIVINFIVSLASKNISIQKGSTTSTSS